MTHSLYGGEVTLDFLESKHWYTVNGSYVPSVTTITKVIDKPALMYWAVNCGVEFLDKALPVGEEIRIDELKKRALLDGVKTAHRKKSDKAKSIGELAHEWVEAHIKSIIATGKDTQALPVHTEIRSAVEAFLSWEQANEVEYVLSEKKIFSRQYEYAGTLDIKAKVNSERNRIIDIKTSTGIWTEYKIQVAAYDNAESEETGDEHDPPLIIRIPKDGGAVEVVELTEEERETSFRAFLGALVLYKNLKELERSAKARKGAMQ